MADESLATDQATYCVEFDDRAFHVSFDPGSYAGEETYRRHAESIGEALRSTCKFARVHVESGSLLEPGGINDLRGLLVASELLGSLMAALVANAVPEVTP